MKTVYLDLVDEAATQRLGQDFALAVRRGDCITLEGDLGVGKSTFARALIRHLSGDDTYEVPSPTFTLVQSYPELYLPVAHADLYRIASAQEIVELGFEELLQQGILLVEWPQKAEGLLPLATFALQFEHDGQGRRVEIKAAHEAMERLQRSLAIRTFLTRHDRKNAVRHYLTGDASRRAYELVQTVQKCEVLMDAPIARQSAKGQGDYAAKVHLAVGMEPFIGIDRLLREQGYKAPEIAAFDIEQGLLLMEDMGQEGILDQANAPIIERYKASIELLADMHGKKWPEQKIWSDCTLTLSPYDQEAMLEEVLLLMEWYKPYVSGAKATDDELAAFRACWMALFEKLATIETSLVLRDFHSPNILWQAQAEGLARIGIIDFQDAVIGPSAYDVVSLTQDARIQITAEQENILLDHYCYLRKNRTQNFDEEVFRMAYAICGAQRLTKILGGFTRLKQRDGKDHYMHLIPQLLVYLSRHLCHPDLGALKDLYHRFGLVV